MTAATTTRSAYPRTVPDLIPHARDLAADLGTLPSRNKLMKTFHVGSDKAKALIAALTANPIPATPAGPEPTDTDPILGDLDDTAAPLDAERKTPPADVPAEPVAEAPPAEPAAETAHDEPYRQAITWPVLILCLPAFVAIWGGWVEMGRLTGFGKVTLLPGILDSFQLNTAITLPVGVETYAAYALFAWLSGRARGDARTFAKCSALASLTLGALGQIAYHLMNAWHWTSAPWPITAAVACIPVAVLGMGAALAHLMHKH